jgi:putative ABC transport system permease protein
VLGFNQTEVGFMLLGEQAVLTLIAVPVGFALGFGICALVSLALDSELFRIPLVVSGKTYAFSFVVVAIAAFLSGLLVSWRLRHLDLIAVLKTRE